MDSPVRAAGRTVATLVAALAGVLLPAAGPPPATAAAEPCVGVIVDARLLGGAVTTGCATGDPDSGLDALTRAGFRYAFVPRQPGLVCQIDGAPACEDTGATTYWSYWHRAKGSATWTYSTVGAAGYDPAPGSTEAWVWQDGGKRRPPDVALRTICPQAFPTPTATPSPSPSRKASTAGTPEAAAPRTTSEAAAPRTTSEAAGRPDAEIRATTPASAAARTPSSAEATPATAATTPAPRRSRSAEALVPVGDEGDGGTWTGTVIAAVLLSLLGAATLARARRPRSRP